MAVIAVVIEYSITIIERMLFLIDFGNVFILIPLNILNIEQKEDLDTDESENFNVDI